MNIKALFGAKPARPMITPDPYVPTEEVWNEFWRVVGPNPPRNVLEAGTRRTVPEMITHHRDKFPSGTDYLMADVQEGVDVDVVADLHNLPVEWANRFDCFIATSVFEHLERPWIAAQEIAKVLAPGGNFIVITHQTFPIHGHPNDFFRFSKEALGLIFEDAGLVVRVASYSDRCLIVPPESMIPYGHLEFWNREYPSYAMVGVTGHKS